MLEFRAGQGRGSEGSSTLTAPCVLPTDHQNNMAIVIPVAFVMILGAVGAAIYIYNYQRKIQKYELQKARKAQEEAAMKLTTPATPP